MEDEMDIGKSINDKVEKLVGESADKIIAANIEKVKTHFRENKNTYIAAGAGLVVGGLTIFVFKNTPQRVTVINNFTFYKDFMQ
jgi:hypothetical protein